MRRIRCEELAIGVFGKYLVDMEESKMISIRAFCAGHDIDWAFIEELLDFGLIELQAVEDDFFLPEEQLADLERMKRLYFDLGINAAGVGVVVQLLHRIEVLEEKLRRLSAAVEEGFSL